MPAGNHASGSRLSPAVIALVVGALVVAAAGALVVFKAAGGSDPGDGKDHRISADTPDFSFEVRKAVVVPTVTGDRTTKEQANVVAQSVADELANFYKTAYLDPNNWSSGKYEAVWTYFDRAAVADAKSHAESLTLGDGSGYDSVAPKPGTTTVKILMGSDGKPQTVAAQVTFGVLATDGSGAQTTFASMGQYFLKPVGKEWTIFAFKIQKSSQAGDQIVGSPSPPTKKTKPSPESSPS